MVYVIFGTSVFLLSLLFFLYRRYRKKEGYNFYYLEELQDLITARNINYYIIDIRSEDSYENGHVPTSVNIPARNCTGLLPVDDLFILTVVYGNNRQEARKIARKIGDFGYFNVHYTDPYSRWKGEIREGSRP